ncbi:hypothetical protein [Thermoactinomyces mirandus]|uniref:DUF3806 domain-containing protein n=1 Tax=Thermoactinomyces mirandus TaxID=2756294 RepID=A0A7W1XUS7_9BACL|nr:hypothetical protein [Thermoactinomyces mirandus]MBA4603641.1 hypothetical protein [Thermoactinomyces mirandus]
MTREKFFSSEDEFQKWLFFQSDELESFIKEFDCLDLDYSPESLVQLEQWILKRHSSPKSFIKDEKAEVIDAMLRYVGQIYVKHLKWIWDIELKDQQYVFYSMPLVKPKDDKDNIYAESPFSLLVASTDRRIGDYMYRMFMNMKKEMGKRD